MTSSLTLGSSRFEIASLLASRSFAQALTWAPRCLPSEPQVDATVNGSYRFHYRHRCNKVAPFRQAVFVNVTDFNGSLLF